MNQAPILSRFVRAMLVGIALVFLSAPAAAAEAPPWSYRSPSKIVYFEITPLGSLAVTSAAGLSVLDPASGVPQWSRSDLRRLDVIEGTPFGVARLENGAEVIELDSGKTKWKFADAGVNGTGEFVAYTKSGLLMLVDLSGPAPALIGADLETGTVRWKQPAAVDAAVVTKNGRSFYLSPHNLPLQDTDSTIVIYPSHGGPIRLHLGTGQVLWRAQGWGERKGPDLSWGVPPSQLVRDRNVFVPYDRRLLALDPDDGHIVWDHAEKFQVVQMEACALGLLVRDQRVNAGLQELRLLDRATGRDVWVVPFKTLAPVSPFVIRGEKAYTAGIRSLVEIALATGDTRNLGTFKFEGKELPGVLELSDAGFLLASSQNLCAFDSTGTELYHRYLKAPSAGFMAKLASTALLVGFNVASVGYAGGGATVFTNNPVLSMRFRASTNARNFAYILTSEPNSAGREGFSLVRVDKRTGGETGRLWMEDRSPDYRVDPISGTVYLLRDDLEISALRY